MKVKECRYEETYGGQHIYEFSVGYFERYDYLKLHKREDSITGEELIYIDITRPGYICKKEYLILDISDSEVDSLKNIATVVDL